MTYVTIEEFQYIIKTIEEVNDLIEGDMTIIVNDNYYEVLIGCDDNYFLSVCFIII